MEPKRPKKSLSFIDKLKSKEGGEDNISKLIQSLLMSKWKQVEDKRLMINYEDTALTYEEQLITELSKPIVDLKALIAPVKKMSNMQRMNVKPSGTLRKFKSINKNNSDETRDVEKIMYFMKQLQGWEKFMKLHGLDDEHFRKACSYFEHVHYPKGTYIVRQGDPSNTFYGVIKGNISLRVKKANPNAQTFSNFFVSSGPSPTIPSLFTKKDSKKIIIPPTLMNIKSNSSNSLSNLMSRKKDSVRQSPKANGINYTAFTNKNLDLVELGVELELMSVSSGMCFGEWGLIYSIARTASAFTTEDTDLFCMDKEFFELIFNKAIMKADNEKKNFIIKRIPSFKTLGKTHDILKKLIPLFCDNRTIIYTELDLTDYIYLVYQGECKLQKRYYDRKATNKEDIHKNKEKLITYMRIDKGGLAGLEVTTNTKLYDFNLVCCRDNSIIYKICLKQLKECSKYILEYLSPLYLNQQNLLANFSKKYESLKDKFKLTNTSKVGWNTKSEKILDFKVANIERSKRIDVEKLIEEVKFAKKIPKINIKVNKMVSKPLEDGFFEKLKRSKFRRGGKEAEFAMAILKSPVQTELLSSFRFKSSNTLVEIKTEKPGNVSLKALDLAKKPIHTFNIFNTNDANPESRNKQTKYMNNLITNDFTTQTDSRLNEMLTDDKYFLSKSIQIVKKVEENIIIIADNVRKIKLNKFNPSIKIKYNTSMTGNMNLNKTVNTSVNKTISLWNKTLNESSMKYNSGAFNLPLVSIIHKRANKTANFIEN